MSLDNIDLWWLDQEGDYLERMRQIGGETKNQDYARKQVTGVNLYLKYKESEGDKESDYLKHYQNYSFTADGSMVKEKIIQLTNEEAQNQDEKVILEKMGLDPVMWRLLKCDLSFKGWDVTMKLNQGTDEEGNKLPEEPLTRTNYGYKCRVQTEPRVGELNKKVIQQVFEELEPPKLEQIEFEPGDKCLEANIPDAHIGLQAWAAETGEANYDLKIAVETYKDRVREMLGKVEQYGLQIERVWYPVGQDFFHIDNEDNTTTAGTHVDTDGRWKKIYKAGTDLLIWTIEQIRQRVQPERFEVFHVPGNHDEKFSYTAILHLHQTYNGVDGVFVDIEETDRKYRQYGKVAVGFSHGREERKRIDELMQEEEPKLWGATRYREFHINDLHQERLREPLGLKIRRMPSIAPGGSWSAKKGYKALRMAEFLVWDKERGLDTIINSVVEWKEE